MTLRKESRHFLHYLVLRGISAVGTLLAGVCQTYTFAHVLDAHRFSLFIVIGNLGLSLWLFDLGIAKVLYVNLRERFLAGRLAGDLLATQATAVVLFYGALVAAGSAFVCLGTAVATPTSRLSSGIEFALFFCYTALNLVWFTLRNVSSATDQFLFFEVLEVVRRIGHLTLMFFLLAALPFLPFLILSNMLWAVLLAVMIRRLRHRGSLDGSLAAIPRALGCFFRTHRPALLASGSYAAGEIYIYNFPSVLVPMVHGLGAPTIIFDTVFKIFRGATVLFSAACDLLVPRQTQAFAEGDGPGLRRATILALVLGAVLAAALCGLLLVAGDRLYRLLLGDTATIPSSFTPILIALIVCNLFQTVSNFLLVHTGFFPLIARAAGAMVLVMTAVAAIDIAWFSDLRPFALLYMAAYGAGALLYVVLAIRYPLRTGARRQPPCGPSLGTGDA